MGTVGKLGGIAADLVDGEQTDTLSKMGDTIAKAKAASDKSNEAAAKAKKDGTFKEPTAVSGVIDGLGPSLSLAGEAINALQVPESEIEAELEKLKAQSPEWNEMADKIIELNSDKAKIFNDLISALQIVGEGYSRLANNADSIVIMQKQKSSTLAKLNMDAIQVIEGMSQKARISLQRALYLMVKSYETTVMKAITVNWKMDKVLKGITNLLKPDSGFDAKTINAHVKALKPIFQENLNTVKERLLAQYGFEKEDPVVLEFGLTKEQTEKQLWTLNETGSLILDPVALGLILPGKQRLTLADLEISAIEYDEDGPALPASGNMLVSLQPDEDSTVRVSDNLYVVRSNTARPWTWTKHFSNNMIDDAGPSTSSLDLLNSILSSSDDSIKQKLASAPLWSDLNLKISFTPQLAKNKRPRIKKLIFKATTSTWAAPATQRVLDVRCFGAKVDVNCTPNDLGGRGNGFGNLYRIYATRASVKLKAPLQTGEQNFSHWKVLNNDAVEIYHKENVTIHLSSHTQAYCYYESQDEVRVEAEVSLLDNPKLAKLAVAEASADKKLLAKMNDYIETQSALKKQARSVAKTEKRKAEKKRVVAKKKASVDHSALIRIAPAKNAQVIEAVSNVDKVTVLDETESWQKVQLGSVVGYLKK